MKPYKARKSDSHFCYKVKIDGQWIPFTGFTDKRATEEKQRQHQGQIDRGEVGIVNKYSGHNATPLATHIADFTDSMDANGKDAMHVANTRRFLLRIATECGWTKLSDITSHQFGLWRASLARSPRTKNAYTIALNSFCNWAVKNARIAVSPVSNIDRVEQRGKETRIRRSLTDAEITRLLAVAGEYRPVYLTALTTGLRRGELTALRWADVNLTAIRPFITVRASISKNHKNATMFLRQDVADALRAIVGPDTGLVFNMPGRKRFYSHLLAAGIAAKDAEGNIIRTDGQGRTMDFHCLRHTFITGLSKAGVSPRVAMELARHSDIGLTMGVYTDAGLLATADAVNSLPLWNTESQIEQAIATGTNDAAGSVTKSVTMGATKSSALLGICTHVYAQSAVNGSNGPDSVNMLENTVFPDDKSNRGDRIRTCDPLTPSQVR